MKTKLIVIVAIIAVLTFTVMASQPTPTSVPGKEISDEVASQLFPNHLFFLRNGIAVKYTEGQYLDTTQFKNTNLPIELILKINKIKYEIINGRYFILKSSDVVIETPVDNNNGTATPDPTATVDKGRVTDFNFEEDSIATQSSKDDFIAKYGIGGYASPEMIPSPWNTHPKELSLGVTAEYNSQTGVITRIVPDYDIITWTNEMFNLYYKNPPSLMGKDGSKLSYSLSKHDFFEWLRDNDDMLYGQGEATVGSPGSNFSIGKENISLDNGMTFDLLDKDDSPYIKFEIDAELWMTSSFSPSSAVYLKAISGYYFSNKTEADQFYKLVASYWMKQNGLTWEGTNTQLNTSYKIGERTIRLQNISQNGMTTIFITDKGFNWEHFIDRLGVNQKYYTQDYKNIYPNRNGEGR